MPKSQGGEEGTTQASSELAFTHRGPVRIEILSEAENDLVVDAKFYERQRTGLGELLS
jgi:hypothetical protein